MGLSQKDQTKHNTLLRLGPQSVKIIKTAIFRGNDKKKTDKCLKSQPKIFGIFKNEDMSWLGCIP